MYFVRKFYRFGIWEENGTFYIGNGSSIYKDSYRTEEDAKAQIRKLVKREKYNATFVSVWDGGIEVHARCVVDIEKREILKIGKNDIGNNEGMLDCLDEEYVILDFDGKQYSACSKDDADMTDKNIFVY